LKSPLAFLLFLVFAIAIATVIKTRHNSPPPAILAGRELHWRCVWVSLVVFTAACLLNRLDISIRHFSIPLALLILMLAPLPRMLELLRYTNWTVAKVGNWTTMALAAAAVVTAIRGYPNYFPFINRLGMGRPGYALVNDSNLDWNHALPEVAAFASRYKLSTVLLDEFGFSEPQAYVSQAQIWDCQQPSSADAGRWAVISANNIADSRNCRWLLRYSHQELAGGSMYAFRLPDVIPRAGAPGGPPMPQDYRYFGGMAFHGVDMRTIFHRCNRDPQQLQLTMSQFEAEMDNYRKKK
jgi:hypothetical protein